jgi:hypothetical protein
MPRWSCLIRQLPAPSHLRIQRRCAHIIRPAEQRCRAALQHASVAFAHKHHNHERKQAAQQPKARVCGKCLGRTYSVIASAMAAART